MFVWVDEWGGGGGVWVCVCVGGGGGCFRLSVRLIVH